MNSPCLQNETYENKVDLDAHLKSHINCWLLLLSIILQKIQLEAILESGHFFLCTLYINDIYIATEIGEFILFADDTMLFYSHDSVLTLMSLINSELSVLSGWFEANKLSVNITKANYTIFKPKQKRQISDFNLKINNKEINRVN